MLKLGATTLPVAGWMADPRQPEESRSQRLNAIRELVEDHGLSAVELTLDLAAIYPQIFDTTFYQAVGRLQQELGFVCTAHLPFLWVDLASINEPIRRASLECMRQVLEALSGPELETYVLHLWGFTTRQIAAQLQHPAQRQAILAVLMAQAGRSLMELCEVIDPPAVCVENLEDSIFQLALPLIEGVGASICLDVGHLIFQGGDESEFWDRHRERIREVHLHDAAKASEARQTPARDHLSLGNGTLDYAAFLQNLQQEGFDGPVILELNSRADLVQSLRRLAAFL